LVAFYSIFGVVTVEKVKKFGAHVVSYLTNGAMLLAGLDPATLPPSWLPYIAAAGLLVTGAHNVQAAGKKFDPAIKSLVGFGVGAVLLAYMVSGCSFLKPENAVLHQVAVQYATGKYIEGADEGKEIDRACKIIAVSETVAALATSDTVTLDGLEAHALSVVANASMSPADRILANTLVAAVVAELRARVDTGVLSDQDRYRVGLVLGWVKQAAGAYVPVKTGT
jgi:hypothetical protein